MRIGSVVLLALMLASCTPAQPPAPETPAAPAPQIQASLNHVMRGILFPNSNILFDAQDTDPGAPIKEGDSSNPYAGTYGGWERVENASMALYEAANLVALPGRKCANGKDVPLNDPTYQKGLAALRDVSMQSYKVAQSKNMEAMLDVADKMTQACATCHDAFRDKVVDGKPVGIEGRC